MANKKNNSLVTVISNLTNGEAMNLKSIFIEKSNKIAPKAKYFASTGDGANVARTISRYEAKRITKK